jgi:membrane protein
MEDSTPNSRGRNAQDPLDIPLKGWWDILWRVVKRVGSDNVTLVSGGVAMYLLLSVFPGLAAFVSVYGLIASPGDVIQHMKDFSRVLPPGVWDIFNTQLQSLVRQRQGTLGFGALLGILLALWSARSAMAALMTSANIAYGEREKRSFLRQTLLSLVLTVGAVAGFLLMLLLGIGIPLVLKVMGTGDVVQVATTILRLALLWGLAVLGLAIVYRYAPSRKHARWRWVTIGSAIAATLWLCASLLFAFYVQHFASYGKTYGSLGSVIVLLMWFYISSVIAVLGAELNAESERQTREDSTLQHAPLGHRGAFAADTVGPSKDEPPAPSPAAQKSDIAGS